MILVNDIEHVVKIATTTWKNIYKLHQQSDFVIHVSDKEDDDNDDEDDVEIQDDVNLDDEEKEQEATEKNLPEIQSIEETDPEKIATIVMASFPHSLRKDLIPSSSEKASVKLVMETTATPYTQPISAPVQLSAILTEVTSTSSTEQPVLPPSSYLATQQLGISTISEISTFVSIPSISIIVTIPSMQIVSTKIVERKPQLSTKVSSKDKGKEEDIDLDEDIVIPNWDISTINLDQINIISELLQKKAKQKKLREEKRRENQVLEDVKNILIDALSTEVDSTQPILVQLAEVVHKFNEDLNGQEKLLQRAERKFENKVLEQVAQKIGIYQVDLSTILSSLETFVNNVTSLFRKLCDTSSFTQEIKDKLSKIDEDLKESAHQLSLDPSYSSAHYSKIRFLTNLQA